MRRRVFLSDDVFIFISNTPKSKVLNFVFSVRKLVTCFIFGTTHFLISTISSSDSEIGKIGISNISNIKKWGILNSKHVTSFQTIKEPKLRNLGHSNKNTDAIAWKILLYIRFRAYSPCSLLLTKEVLRLLRF